MAVNIGPKIGIEGESEYRKQITGIIQQAKTLASEMKVVTSSFDKNTSAQDKATATGKVLEKQIDVQRQRVQALTEMLQKSVKETGENSTATLKWQQAVNNATADLKNMERELEESAGATDEVGDALKKAKASIISFGDVLKANVLSQAIVDGVKKLGAAIKGLAVDTIETGSGFEAAMSQVAATMGITADDISTNVNGAGDTFDLLREKAKQIGAETNFTATEAAEGLNILAMSGYDAESSVAMIEDVLHLAAAGAMDMGSAAGYVAGAMKGFSDDTRGAGYYADLMAKGATLANTNVSQLGEALSDASGTAKTYGQSAEAVTLALLRLGEQGEVGSAASTALAAAMKNLYAPTDQAAGVMEMLGVSTFDSSGSARDFNIVVNELQASMSALTDEERTQYAQTIFGIQGFDAYNKMIVTSADKQAEWAAALRDSTGEAAQQYATMTDNLSGDMAIMNSAFDGVKVEIYEHFTPALREAVTQMTGLAGKVQEFISSGGLDRLLVALQYLVPAVGALTAALVAFKATVAITTLVDALTKSLKAYQAANEGATIAQWALNAAQAASPVGVVVAVVVAAVAAIVAGILLLWNTSEDFRNTVKGWWENLMRKIQETKDAFVQFWAAIKEIWDNFIAAIKKAKDAVHDFFFKTIPEGFHAAVDFFKSLPDQAMQWGKDMIQGFMDGVLDKARGLIDAVKGVADKVRGFLHFSRPDEGPLRDYETWMPDMMRGLAKGITDNAWRLEKAASLAAGSISVAAPIVPTMQLAGAYGTASQQAGGITNLGGVTLHIYGAEGQDVNALADIVMDRIEAKVEQIGGAWV